MSRSDIAKEQFLSGRSCAQSVVMAFSDLIDVDKNTLLKLSSSFGGGFGRLREVCGAFSGMCMVAGYLRGYDGENGVTKAEHYALVRKLAQRFKEVYGSVVCREILGDTVNLSSSDPSVRTDEYKAKRPCPEICKLAAQILVEELLNNQKSND